MKKGYQKEDMNLIGKLLEGNTSNIQKKKEEEYPKNNPHYMREIPDRAVSAPIPDLYGLDRVIFQLTFFFFFYSNINH